MPIRPENLDRYPDNWAEISFRIRFARALGHCECHGECGTNHHGRCPARHNGKNPRTGAKIVLTTAHLDHTPENVDDANLRAFCQACHLAYDATEHKATAARTRAAKKATWNQPLPGLEPAPAAPVMPPQRVGATTGALPNRGHFPAGKGDVDLDRFSLIRVPETPAEELKLAEAYVDRRANALGWTTRERNNVLDALFARPRAVSTAERHASPRLYREDPDT